MQNIKFSSSQHSRGDRQEKGQMFMYLIYELHDTWWVSIIINDSEISMNITKYYNWTFPTASLCLPPSFFLLNCLAYFFQCHLFFNLWTIYFPIKVGMTFITSQRSEVLVDWHHNVGSLFGEVRVISGFHLWDRIFTMDKWLENQTGITGTLLKEKLRLKWQMV